MTLEQLVYTPHCGATSHDQQPTMVLMVDPDSLHGYQHDKSIPLAQVVDSFQVFKYDSGKSGSICKPSRAEIQQAFGTTRADEVIQLMLEHGSLRHKSVQDRQTEIHN